MNVIWIKDISVVTANIKQMSEQMSDWKGERPKTIRRFPSHPTQYELCQCAEIV